jgi:hypothetical protein
VNLQYSNVSFICLKYLFGKLEVVCQIFNCYKNSRLIINHNLLLEQSDKESFDWELASLVILWFLLEAEEPRLSLKFKVLDGFIKSQDTLSKVFTGQDLLNADKISFFKPQLLGNLFI